MIEGSGSRIWGLAFMTELKLYGVGLRVEG
jgi:hypothetical protein